MKRVLAISYSQSGQLNRALRSLLSGLDNSDFEVHFEVIRAVDEYPFPWRFGEFLDVFPESVNADAPEIDEPRFDPDGEWDLVILGYTVWYLAPALPIQGFLKSPSARVLRGRSVITLGACRNMWHSASELLKRELDRLGAVHLDNIVISDSGPAWATFVSTPRWMLTGRRDRFLRIFPPAGVDEATIRGLDRFGEAITRNCDRLAVRPGKPLLGGLGAVDVNKRFVIPEIVGRQTFRPWAKLLRALGPRGGRLRRAGLLLFCVYLVLAILVLIPVIVAVRIVFYPLVEGPLRAYVQRLKSPTGDD